MNDTFFNGEENEMIKPGDTLPNPITGEQVTFLKTSDQTCGEYCVVEMRFDRGAVGAGVHAHPDYTETVEVVTGTLGVEIDGRDVEAHIGDIVVIEPRTPHRCWNAGEGPLVLRCEIRPARLFETMIAGTTLAKAVRGLQSRTGSLRVAAVRASRRRSARITFHPVSA
jgi:quercetin dioxygenase-like cupin family protein